MPIISVWDISYNATTQRLVAGTYAKSLQTIDVTTLTTGIAALNKNTPELLVYPSIVTNNEFKIKTNHHGNTTKVSIIDLNGKAVKVLDIEAELTNVDVSNLAVGAYFVKLSSDKGITVKRIIKN